MCIWNYKEKLKAFFSSNPWVSCHSWAEVSIRFDSFSTDLLSKPPVLPLSFHTNNSVVQVCHFCLTLNRCYFILLLVYQFSQNNINWSHFDHDQLSKQMSNTHTHTHAYTRIATEAVAKNRQNLKKKSIFQPLKSKRPVMTAA